MGSCMKSMSRLAVCWRDTSTKPTCLYIATARNYAIMSDKFKSDNLYLTSNSQKDDRDSNKQHNYKCRQCNCYSNVQCLNKETHVGLQVKNREVGCFKDLPDTSFPFSSKLSTLTRDYKTFFFLFIFVVPYIVILG